MMRPSLKGRFLTHCGKKREKKEKGKEKKNNLADNMTLPSIFHTRCWEKGKNSR
jgi:hypothetical protein